MDAGGVAWCQANRDEILMWLRSEQSRSGWAAKLKAAALAVTTGLAFRLDVSDLPGSLLDEALRRARVKTTDPPGAVGSLS